MTYPPAYTPGTVKLPPNRFSVASAMDGYEVVDHDGRPVAWADFQYQADEVAIDLNKAAQNGSHALSARLGSL